MLPLDQDKQRRFAVDVVREAPRGGFPGILGRRVRPGPPAGPAPQGLRRGHQRHAPPGPPGLPSAKDRGRGGRLRGDHGPRSPGAGQIEVATFRRDDTYSDGRHPDRVVFSSPQEDASRRDFTVNGLFYDPIEERVIDLVGGQQDLAARLIRAIGDPDRAVPGRQAPAAAGGAFRRHVRFCPRGPHAGGDPPHGGGDYRGEPRADRGGNAADVDGPAPQPRGPAPLGDGSCSGGPPGDRARRPGAPVAAGADPRGPRSARRAELSAWPWRHSWLSAARCVGGRGGLPAMATVERSDRSRRLAGRSITPHCARPGACPGPRFKR